MAVLGIHSSDGAIIEEFLHLYPDIYQNYVNKINSNLIMCHFSKVNKVLLFMDAEFEIMCKFMSP